MEAPPEAWRTTQGSRSKVQPPGPPSPAGRVLTRVVGYVRVSTERQADEGVSLDAQRAKLRAHCAALDLELVAIEADEGVSAKTLDRPALQRALTMLREHRADALLVPKLDRLTRRVVDLGHLIETYFAEGRWALVSVAEPDRHPAGRMTLFILMTVAQWEREAIGERTADALAHLKAEGVPLGRPALGWRHTPGDQPVTGRRVLGVVEEELATVARIRALRAEGQSYAAIARQLAADGRPSQRGGRWLPNTVRRVWLRNAQAWREAGGDSVGLPPGPSA